MEVATKMNIIHIKKGSFCHTCLSTDRRLFPFIKYIDVFKKFCSTSTKNTLKEAMICWECVAFMEKILEFQVKAKRAQEEIRLNAQENVKQNTLSNLKSVIINSDSIINVKYEETESKELLPEVKQEVIDNNTDQGNVSDLEMDKFCSYDIKKEKIDQDVLEDDITKCEIEKCDTSNRNLRRRRKQYKFVYKKIKRQELERLSLVIPLNTDQMRMWVERDRRSELYKNSTYKCESCAYGWKNEKKYIEHNQKFHDPSPGKFSCDICCSYFTCKKTLSRHISGECQLRECGTCGWQGRTRGIISHLAAHRRYVQCRICKAAYPNVRLFYKHYKELHELFICDHCGKRCKSKNMLVKHLRHHFEKYDCKICNKSYKTRGSYNRHYSTKHASSTDESAYCVQCDKQFSNSLTYRRHVASSAAHSCERDGARTAKQISCPDCGRQYSRKTYMMNHYKHVHMNQSNYYCKQCDKHFLNRTRYVDHTRYNHEGVKKEKNKLCNICGRGFAANRTLVNHIRTHSGERPYECEYCGAKFTQKYAMLSHVQYIHLKNKRKHSWLQ